MSAGLDAPVTTAVVLRSFLTVHIVLGRLLVAVFNVANLFRYWAIDWLVNLLRPWLDGSDAAVAAGRSAAICQSVAVRARDCRRDLRFVPLSIAYWLPSVSRPESYERTRLVAFMICSVTGFVMSLEAGA